LISELNKKGIILQLQILFPLHLGHLSSFWIHLEEVTREAQTGVQQEIFVFDNLVLSSLFSSFYYLLVQLFPKGYET